MDENKVAKSMNIFIQLDYFKTCNNKEYQSISISNHIKQRAWTVQKISTKIESEMFTT